MNLVKAKEKHLIFPSWESRTLRPIPGRWRLVTVVDDGVLVAKGEFTSKETQGLIDLREKVEGGLISS